MPKSLRNKIKHLAYKGELNERECNRLLYALDREGTAHFVRMQKIKGGKIFTEDVLRCSECGNAVMSVYVYCPMCGKSFIPQPPTMMCEED